MRPTAARLLGRLRREALLHQVEDLEHRLPGYAREGVGRDGGDAGELTPHLIRSARLERLDGGTFWLSPTPERPRAREDPKPWGTWLNRIATWARLRDRTTGGTLLVVNTTSIT